MTTAYTSLLGLALPVTGELSGTWGDTVNNSITSLLDSAIAGTQTITADITLTTTTGAANQSRQAILLCSPASANITVTAPAQSKIYTVINTSGTYTVKIRGVGPTTGVTLAVSESAVVAWNGTDFIRISSNTATTGNFTVNGNLSVTGNTTLGDASADTVTVNGTTTFNASPIISVTDNTNAALRITQLGTGNALLVEDSGNPDSTPFVIDANGRVVVGGTASVGGTVEALAQVQSTGSNAANSIQAYSTTNPPTLEFDRSRGSLGAQTVVASGDVLGRIFFDGSDGAAFIRGAQIQAEVDGTPGTNDMPGRLVFSTTADGASSPTERMRIDSSGNLGLGVTPSAWRTTEYKAVQIGNGASFYGRVTAGDQDKAGFSANAFFDQTDDRWEYIATDFASRYDQTGGTHIWNIAPSGTAGNAITFTQAMTLDASGRLGIGTTTPVTKLEIAGNNNITWSVTASITGTTMDVTAVAASGVAVGDLVFGANIQAYTRVTALGTGTGGIGTYTVSVSQTAASGSVAGGPTYANTLIRITDTDTSQNIGQPNGGLQFFTSDTSSPTAGVGAYVAALAETVTPDTALVFGTRNNNGGGIDANERMRIDSSGNVGIGTSSPSAKLDVRGSSTFLVNATNPTAWVSVDSALTTGSMYNQWNTTSSVGITGTYTNHPHTFVTNNNERMRIDSSGNVGIGTSSPSGRLHVESSSGGLPLYVNSTASAQNARIRLNSTDNASSVSYVMSYSHASLNKQASILLGGTGAVGFYVGQTAGAETTTGTLAQTIDSSGNLLVGTTSSSGKTTITTSTTSQRALYVSQTAATSNEATPAARFTKSSATTTTGQVFIEFTVNNDAAGSGQINANGASAAAFGSFSDRRLKENITDLPSQLANIMALRTVEFDYIESEGGGHQIGFIAQEVQQVYPDLVGERADGMLTLTDLNKNDARLIKCIQEQQALITTLTARITALENA